MDELVNVFVSWQSAIIAIFVFIVYGILNEVVGPKLWRIGNRRLRVALKFFEEIKMVGQPCIGFALGWIPQIPRPGPLEDANQFTVALLYAAVGFWCAWFVKGIKKALEARGINVDLDLTPKEQKKLTGR